MGGHGRRVKKEKEPEKTAEEIATLISVTTYVCPCRRCAISTGRAVAPRTMGSSQ